LAGYGRAHAVSGAGVGDDFKAIVIAGRSTNRGARDPNAPHSNCGYAFEAFATALAFMRSTKAQTLIIEFSVETDTLDFYDAVKTLGVPVVFSANRLEPSQFAQFGIKASDVVYPERGKPSESFADYRPRPGIRGSSSNVSLMTSTAPLDA
jgi:hypothetical protein